MAQNSGSKIQKFFRTYQYAIGLVVFASIFGAVGAAIEYAGHAAESAATVVGIAGKCLDRSATTTTGDYKVELNSCNGGSSQQWVVNGTTSTSGTIVNTNGDCIGIAGGSSANFTDAILNNCNGNASQQWFYDSTRQQILNEKSGTCLDDFKSGTADGNQIDIYTCNGTAAQKWDYKGTPIPPPTCPPGDTGTPPNCVAPPPPTCPPGDTGTPPNCVAPPTPTPSPSPSPSPNPTPSSASTPTPSSSSTTDLGTGSDSQAFSPLTVPASGSGDQTGNNTAESGSTPTLSVVGSSVSLPSTPGKVPVISGLTVGHITSSSAIITWGVNTKASYVLRYGTNESHPSFSQSFASSNAIVTVTLHSLPSGKRIYLSISPENNGLSGTTKHVAFKTSSYNFLPIIVGFGLFGAVAFALFKLRSNSSAPQGPIIETPTAFPQEDEAAYNRRVYWWRTPDSGNAQPRKKEDDIPDMFEQGRARLEEEERQRRLPK